MSSSLNILRQREAVEWQLNRDHQLQLQYTLTLRVERHHVKLQSQFGKNLLPETAMQQLGIGCELWILGLRKYPVIFSWS